MSFIDEKRNKPRKNIVYKLIVVVRNRFENLEYKIMKKVVVYPLFIRISTTFIIYPLGEL